MEADDKVITDVLLTVTAPRRLDDTSSLVPLVKLSTVILHLFWSWRSVDVFGFWLFLHQSLIGGNFSFTNTVRNRATGFLVVQFTCTMIIVVLRLAAMLWNNDLCCQSTNCQAFFRYVIQDTMFLNSFYLFIDSITITLIFCNLRWWQALVGGVLVIL